MLWLDTGLSDRAQVETVWIDDLVERTIMFYALSRLVVTATPTYQGLHLRWPGHSPQLQTLLPACCAFIGGAEASRRRESGSIASAEATTSFYIAFGELTTLPISVGNPDEVQLSL
jgi:hypothetical protein